MMVLSTNLGNRQKKNSVTEARLHESIEAFLH